PQQIAIVDLTQIATLARGRDSAQRARLALTLNESLGEQADLGSDRERALFNGILEQLLASIEHDVRTRLAAELAGRSDVPRPLVALLANQDIEIARPLLHNSPVLNDADLIEVIRHRTLEHQLAVAARADVSEGVSEELVGTGQTRVIVSLLNNQSARLRAATLGYLAEQAERVDAFREPLARRHDLPEPVARRVYRLVSGALREGLAQRFDFDASVIDSAIETVIRQANEALNATRIHPAMAQALADEIAQADRFDPGLMIDALKRGEIALFEAMLIQQSGLRPGDVRRIIYDAGGETFAIGCRAIGMTPAHFAEMYDLTRRAARQNRTVADEMRKRALTLFSRLEKDAAAAMVRQWRRDPNLIRARFEALEAEHDAVA
ncbi:MAG: DUF2336 domain-containing protein, partial [Alphaproteobacteria bacterium]